MNRAEFVRICREYAEGKEFTLNPDKKFLDDVLNGVMMREEATGMRYCPCRLTTGDPETDTSLLCPCYFQAQERWKNDNMCWCGLFVRK